MIALDSSALIEVVAQQPLAEPCARLLSEAELVIAAATLTEALIVASRKGVLTECYAILGAINLTVEEVDADFAERAAAVYRRWGKGFHRAALNYGDSFSYALAELYDCPLLYVGDDFAQTDIKSALA